MKNLSPENRASKLIRAIRQDRTHGANFLACQAVRALVAAAQDKLKDDQSLMFSLRHAARQILTSHSSMAPVANAVQSFLAAIKPEGCRQSKRVGQNLLRRLKQAALMTAWQAAKRLPQEGVVFTCSYSATVLAALKTARRNQKKRLKIVVLESFKGRHGEHMADALWKSRIPTRLAYGMDMARWLSNCRMVLIGADAVLPDGSVINGAPSARLAKKAQGKVPLYVAADSFKFIRRAKRSPGFDKVSGSYIAGIITEKGVIRPHQACNLLTDS